MFIKLQTYSACRFERFESADTSPIMWLKGPELRFVLLKSSDVNPSRLPISEGISPYSPWFVKFLERIEKGILMSFKRLKWSSKPNERELSFK